jgi:hypothetical protein
MTHDDEEETVPRHSPPLSAPAKDNHYERVRDLLSATQQTKLNAAAGGNIFEGTEQ